LLQTQIRLSSVAGTVPHASLIGPALAARMARYSLSACGPDGAARGELESFIRAMFQRKHGACIQSFLPTLIDLRDRAGQLCGVVGYRDAAQERLFLEQYLDAPVELEVARVCGQPVDRATIAEVGNLAASSCRAARVLAAQLPRRLVAAGHRWIVFTGTRAVRQLLASLDAPIVDLGAADPARLAAGAACWGRYYETEPRVLAGYLPLSFSRSGFAAEGWG
jgi:thermostable hemolysin